jgi:hypothetical protein
MGLEPMENGTLRAMLATSIENLAVYGCGYVYGYPHKKAHRPLEPRPCRRLA